MFAKVDVNGDNAAELYQWLKSEQPGEGESPDVRWNFEKFLINQEGTPVRRYSPGFETKDVAADIAALLEHGPDALSS